MNTDIQEQARETLEIIMAKLDQNLIKCKFDEPISEAARQFKYQVESPMTYKVFHKIIADFVEHIYTRALNASWMLTDPLIEAIFLLENYYSSTMYGTGYTAAMLDADDPETGGIQNVLSNLAEIIKDIERQKYIEGVFIWHLYSNNWDVRCEIARILLQDYRNFIPEKLQKCIPGQLVDEIPLIIYRHVSSDSVLQQISFYNEKSLNIGTLFNEETL